MKKVIDWFSRLFQDERGEPSSKRLVGIVSAIILCIVMTSTVFLDVNTPSDAMVDAIALLAVGGLGFSSVDKFWSSKNTIKKFKDKDDETIN